MAADDGSGTGADPVEDPPQYAQTAAYEWTERAYRLLLSGQLQARSFATDGVVSSHVWGACPRCGHQLDHRQVHTAIAAGPGRQTGGQIIPPTPPTLEVSTTRPTSAAAAASTAARAPSTFTSKTRETGRDATYPAEWKRMSAPFSARLNAPRSSTSARTGRTSRSPRRPRRALSRYVTDTSSPRSTAALATWPPMKPVAPVTQAFTNDASRADGGRAVRRIREFASL